MDVYLENKKRSWDSVSALTIIGDKMENLETYIAFDLKFNTVDGVSHIIQVSAVNMDQHKGSGPV